MHHSLDSLPTIRGNIWDFPKIKGYQFGGPNNKGYSMRESKLGSFYLRKLLNIIRGCGGGYWQGEGMSP